VKRLFLVAGLSFLSIYQAVACTTIIVGKKATADGSILAARNDDGAGTIGVNFLYHKPRTESRILRSTMVNRFSYQLPYRTMGYTGSPRGTASAYDESGFNDAGVGVSATETIFSNEKTLAVDPYVKETGVVEEVIPTVILSQAKTARAGVELLGHLIESVGSAEGFGVAFVDKNEAWYLENAGGHEWLAMRIPDDSYFVSANQSRLGEFDAADRANVLSSPDLIAFAQSHGLYTSDSDQKFSFRRVFGQDDAIDKRYNYPRVAMLHERFTGDEDNRFVHSNDGPAFARPRLPLSVAEVQGALKDYYAGTPGDPYTSRDPSATARPVSVYRTYQSHILQTRGNLPAAIANVEYLDLGMTTLGVYLPFYQGADIPESYRGVTGESDDHSAFWQFRKLQLLAMQDFPDFAPLVQSSYADLYASIEQKQAQFEKDYVQTLKSDPRKARTMLDGFTQRNVDAALALTRQLTNTLITRLSLKTNQLYKFPGA